MILSKIKHRVKKILLGETRNIIPTPINVVDKATITKKAEEADIISFDIFDTLITRKIYSPEDIFSIIDEHFKIKNFKENRIKADSVAREKLGRDVTIDDIYEVLKNDFGIKNISNIKKYEESLELELCIPRKEILEIWNELKEKGKKIILVSDMYLKKSTIEKMLKKCGYQGYSKFYLSNHLNARKDTKTIWEIVKNDYKVEKILHIGDNSLSDALYPKDFGISTIQIDSGKTLAKKTALNSYISNNLSTSDSLFWGTIINEYLFNSPFSNSPEINDLNTLGYLFYGPIFEEFFNFLEDHTKKTDKLLFLSREGYYLQKLYKKYTEINSLSSRKNFYFLASRKATIFTNLTSVKDIEALATHNDYNGSAKNWLKQILNISADFEDFNISLPNDYEKVKPLIKRYAPEVIKNSKTARDNYLLYIKQSVGTLNPSTKIIDLGYSGTIQYELSKMSKKDLCGIYLASSDDVKEYSPKSQLNFLFDTKRNPTYKKLYEYSLVLEFFLSAPYGQLLGFHKKGGRAIPIYNDETLTTKKSDTINSIKIGIEQYFKDTKKQKLLFPEYNISTEAIFYFYTYCIEQNIITKNIKDMFDFTDNFTTDETKNVFKIISKY